MHCLSPSSVLMWALMWVLMWIVMCVLMWILMWLGPHVSPYVNPQNPSASSHTPHTTTSALSGLVASLGLCVCSVCALCVLCVCSVCVLLLSGLPGHEAKLNIKSTKIYQKMQRKSSILGPNIVDFGTHFDISSFPGPNMQHTLILRPANDRLFTHKWSPKWYPKFALFWDLRPCWSAINNCKISLFLVLERVHFGNNSRVKSRSFAGRRRVWHADP